MSEPVSPNAVGLQMDTRASSKSSARTFGSDEQRQKGSLLGKDGSGASGNQKGLIIGLAVAVGFTGVLSIVLIIVMGVYGLKGDDDHTSSSVGGPAKNGVPVQLKEAIPFAMTQSCSYGATAQQPCSKIHTWNPIAQKWDVQTATQKEIHPFSVPGDTHEIQINPGNTEHFWVSQQSSNSLTRVKIKYNFDGVVRDESGALVGLHRIDGTTLELKDPVDPQNPEKHQSFTITDIERFVLTAADKKDASGKDIAPDPAGLYWPSRPHDVKWTANRSMSYIVFEASDTFLPFDLKQIEDVAYVKAQLQKWATKKIGQVPLVNALKLPDGKPRTQDNFMNVPGTIGCGPHATILDKNNDVWGACKLTQAISYFDTAANKFTLLDLRPQPKHKDTPVDTLPVPFYVEANPERDIIWANSITTGTIFAIKVKAKPATYTNADIHACIINEHNEMKIPEEVTRLSPKASVWNGRPGGIVVLENNVGYVALYNAAAMIAKVTWDANMKCTVKYICVHLPGLPPQGFLHIRANNFNHREKPETDSKWHRGGKYNFYLGSSTNDFEQYANWNIVGMENLDRGKIIESYKTRKNYDGILMLGGFDPKTDKWDTILWSPLGTQQSWLHRIFAGRCPVTGNDIVMATQLKTDRIVDLRVWSHVPPKTP